MKIVCRPTARYKRLLRRVWAEKYGHKCAYCLTDCEEESTVDHVVPRSRGGRNSFANLVVCCLKCNQEKAHYLLEEINMTLLLQPIKQYLENVEVAS